MSTTPSPASHVLETARVQAASAMIGKARELGLSFGWNPEEWMDLADAALSAAAPASPPSDEKLREALRRPLTDEQVSFVKKEMRIKSDANVQAWWRVIRTALGDRP